MEVRNQTLPKIRDDRRCGYNKWPALRQTLGGRSGRPIIHSSYTTSWDTTDAVTLTRAPILNYFRAEKAFSSGIVEGFNNKSKLTMRKSYCFHTFHVTETALYHALGKLPEPDGAHRFFCRGLFWDDAHVGAFPQSSRNGQPWADYMQPLADADIWRQRRRGLPPAGGFSFMGPPKIPLPEWGGR